MNLWKLNKVTGYYQHMRVCGVEDAQAWLTMFKADEPQETFVLSVRKPR